MLRIRLLSLALVASALMLLNGCACTGICLSWQHGGCGGCGSGCGWGGGLGGGCGMGGGCATTPCCSPCDPRTCCDMPVSRQGGGCMQPGGGFPSVPVGDMMPGGPPPQGGNPPRVVPVPQAQPSPYQP